MRVTRRELFGTLGVLLTVGLAGCTSNKPESEKPADERRQLAALRILGKAFISEKIEVDKPQQLKIGGIEEGLEKMGLGEEVLREAGFLEQ